MGFFLSIDQAHRVSYPDMFVDNGLFNQTVFSVPKIVAKGFILMQGRHVKMVAHEDAVFDDCPFFDVGANADDRMGNLLCFNDAALANDRLDNFCTLNLGAREISGTRVDGVSFIVGIEPLACVSQN